jgi:membrane-associated phospholipid phosphatase
VSNLWRTLTSRITTPALKVVWARLAWLIILCIIQFLYFPINRAVQGGVILATPLDALIPLWPIWAIPYLLSLGWWMGCFIWATWKMDLTLYQAFIVCMIAIMLVSYAVYLLYPTYVARPLLEGNDWQMKLMYLIYSNDRSYNAFPSGHTYTTVLIGLFWWRWYPRQRWLWVGITVIILLSTLFTRQHNLPDLAGGILLALLGYTFGMGWAAKRKAV